MTRLYLFAINNYPDPRHNLNGCLNDQQLLMDTLTAYGCKFVANRYTDLQATPEAFKVALLEALNRWYDYGEHAIFHYSGHGTNAPSDKEKDGYMEGMYMYGGVLWDYELSEILKQFPEEAGLVILSDSCFSGNQTRGAQKAKFVSLFGGDHSKGKVKRRSINRNIGVTHVLLSGCAENQTSADATFSGTYQGAFTYFFCRSFNPHSTIRQIHKNLSRRLPSARFDQRPQLEGNPNIFNNKFNF